MAVRRNRCYRVDMGVWHSRNDPYDTVSADNPCRVCQAGAVMAQTLKFDPNESILLTDLPPSPDRYALLALNSLRNGNVDHFLVLLNHGPRLARFFRRLDYLEQSRDLQQGYCRYDFNPKKYLAWLRRVETGLRKLGL